jgi:acyl-coenzyme A thioesterase PaaI-like protein
MQSRLERGADALAARRELADRIRELIEASLRCHGSPEDLRATSTRLAAVTDELRALGDGATSVPDGLDGRAGLYLNNPVEGPANPTAPPLGDFRVEGAVLRATAILGITYQGAPGRLHGGWVTALLDEALGRAVATFSAAAMTGSLTVDYHRGTPIGVPLDVEAEVTGRDGRKVYAVGRIVAEGRVTASATATFITVSALPTG